MGEAAVSANVLSDFDSLCRRIAVQASPTMGEDALEPLYEEVLDFLLSHPESRIELAQRLIETIRKYRKGHESLEPLLPSSTIAYSMHVLRWPEIRRFVEEENRSFYAPRMSTFMSAILDAFSDDWEDRDFYKRFHE
jgi:hypothetical protein